VAVATILTAIIEVVVLEAAALLTMQGIAIPSKRSGGNVMEFMDVLQMRRSVRSYKDIPVDQATIQTLIDAAILAPAR
jgi:hypothetical protein